MENKREKRVVQNAEGRARKIERGERGRETERERDKERMRKETKRTA